MCLPPSWGWSGVPGCRSGEATSIARRPFRTSSTGWFSRWGIGNRISPPAWFGEYFEYDRDEDYWLTEVSGLPFGLTGEMLQDGGYPYRGMLYGMTARLYGEVDPGPLWRLLRAFGIDQSRMQGYWLEHAPVTTSHPRVLATTYVRPNGALVALASWSARDETVSLTVDPDLRRALPGLEASAPAVEGLQAAAKLDLSQVRVPANQGRFVLLRPGGRP